MHRLRGIGSHTGTVVNLERGTTESQRRIDILKHNEVSIPLCCLESQFHCDQESVCFAIASTIGAACATGPNAWDGCESPSCHHREVDASFFKNVTSSPGPDMISIEIVYFACSEGITSSKTVFRAPTMRMSSMCTNIKQSHLLERSIDG